MAGRTADIAAGSGEQWNVRTPADDGPSPGCQAFMTTCLISSAGAASRARMERGGLSPAAEQVILPIWRSSLFRNSPDLLIQILVVIYRQDTLS